MSIKYVDTSDMKRIILYEYRMRELNEKLKQIMRFEN